MHRIVNSYLRWPVAVALFLAVRPGSEGSILHWTTRLKHTTCDNRPVAQMHHSELIPRPSQSDLDTPLRFEAVRPFASGSTLLLVVCNGEVHILPGTDSAALKLVVQLGTSLGHERTPKSYLQEFSFGSNSADVEWKLPERSHPVLDVYVPKDTNLDLQMGKTDLEIKGIRGDKLLNMGKGIAKLYVADADAEYKSIKVDIAMGSFSDMRPGGKRNHHVPLHEEFPGHGNATAHLQVAMGKLEIVPE